MLSVTVICVGNLKEDYLRAACSEYLKRLNGYCIPKIVELKDGAPILPHLKGRAYKIALCVEGKQLSSEELSRLMSDLPGRGYSEITFVIGPFDGLPEEVKAACDLRLSFSRMTFPHQLMRVILLEQIYRGLNLAAGGKYHK
ncbi:MAG: 23S rRNA (pseudouridine(1915)-N(3))-methyltransferase RlmH [Eubacteriales bacterium]